MKTKAKKKKPPKLIYIVPHKYGCKNPQQNYGNLNPTMYKKKYAPSPSGIYYRTVRLFQHSFKSQYSPQYEQAKEENQMRSY